MSEAHLQALAAMSLSRGESPGRCELCGWIIRYGAPYGICEDTEALTCENCLPSSGGSDGLIPQPTPCANPGGGIPLEPKGESDGD